MMKSWTIAAMLAGAICTAAAAWADEPDAAGAPIEPILTDDGLYTQEWFLESFLDLAEDLDEAKAEGKRFAIMWELKGCPYCKETHLVNFGDPEINDYVRENFVILQLNFLGSRLVTDFDGEELEERELREKYGIRFTPSFQFFPDGSEQIEGESGQAAEIARMPGYFKPDHFIAMFRFVKDEAYDQQTFREFLETPGSG